MTPFPLSISPLGRPKKSAPAHVEPEFESQELPDEEPAAVIEPDPGDEPQDAGEPGPIPRGAVSQTDAARAAMDAGYDKPAQAVEYIKATFGLDMNPQYFSGIKSRMNKDAGEKKAEPARPGRPPKAAAPIARKPPVENYVAPPQKPKAPGDQVDLIAAMEAMKPLVAALGADKVKRIADLLG